MTPQASDANTGSSQICYAAAQHVVLLAAGEAGQQHILQPACTPAIAALAASADRSIIAAADGASPGRLTAWRVSSLRCLGAWTAPHGIAALHLSSNGSHAAVLSRTTAENDQQVRLIEPMSGGGDGKKGRVKIIWCLEAAPSSGATTHGVGWLAVETGRHQGTQWAECVCQRCLSGAIDDSRCH